MKYYLIFEASELGTKRTHPSYIVERKSTAEAFCKEFSNFYYEEREDGVYITTTSTLGDSMEKVEKADVCGDINPLSKGLHDDLKCPHCGAQYFMEGSSFATTMFCPTIIKDGKVISKDSNIYTTTYHCLNCGKDFKVVNGKVKAND